MAGKCIRCSGDVNYAIDGKTQLVCHACSCVLDRMMGGKRDIYGLAKVVEGLVDCAHTPNRAERLKGWTKEKPSEVGFYWQKWPGSTEAPTIYHVGHMRRAEIEDGYLWFGPIQPPE